MRLIVAFILAVLALPTAPSLAQNQWREFRSDTDGFVVSLPATPTITSRRIGKSNATQTMFLIDNGAIAYLVSVIQLEKGKGPKKPDDAYFRNLVKNYVEGSKTTLRSSRAATVAGRPGMEAISDVETSAHVLDLTAAGDRVYMTVFVGPKGDENGADSTRFRGSFKIVE